jgi:hypothetical protein
VNTLLRPPSIILHAHCPHGHTYAWDEPHPSTAFASLVGGVGCMGLSCTICGALLSRIRIDRPNVARRVFDMVRKILGETTLPAHRERAVSLES